MTPDRLIDIRRNHSQALRGTCTWCGQDVAWPCDTAQMLEAYGELEAQLEERTKERERWRLACNSKASHDRILDLEAQLQSAQRDLAIHRTGSIDEREAWREQVATLTKERDDWSARFAVVLRAIPQTFGEAIVRWPWLTCEPHEWDNRTTVENALWLIETSEAAHQQAERQIDELQASLDTLVRMTPTGPVRCGACNGYVVPPEPCRECGERAARQKAEERAGRLARALEQLRAACIRPDGRDEHAIMAHYVSNVVEAALAEEPPSE